jgi:hypothetical protein
MRPLGVGVVCLTLLLGWALPLPAKLSVGETAAVRIESPHPYPDSDATLLVVWTHTLHHPDASFLKLHVAHLALGPGDVLRLLDGQGRLVAEYGSRLAF